MNYNKNDIEFYVLNKDYKELTTSELELIQSEIKNEAEFNSLKQLLVNLKTVANEAIEPAPELRAALIKDFEQARWKQGIGLDETPVVPLVEKKKEEKKNNKLIGWFSIAASILILIGLVYNKDRFFSPKKNQLALNETAKVEDTFVPKNTKTLKEEKIEMKEMVFDQNSDKELEQEIQEVTNSNKENIVYNDSRVKMSVPESPIAIEEFENEALDSEILAETLDETEEVVFLNMASAKTLAATSNDENSEGLIAEMDFDDSPIDSESVSLENDKDLIGLLYTAL